MKSNTRTKNQKSSKPARDRIVVAKQFLSTGRPLFVAVATGVVFYPSLSNDFVKWDDDTILTNNLHFRGLG
jgi:hypothetical protein